MVIPLTEKDWPAFYYAAKRQGVVIRSRFIGVHINAKRGSPLRFVATCSIANTKKHLGVYPFTAEGESAAQAAYLVYVTGLSPALIKRRHYNKCKKTIR